MVWRAIVATLVLLPTQFLFASSYDQSNQAQGDQYIIQSPDIADVASPDQIAAELGYTGKTKIKAPSKARLQILIDKATRRQKANGSKTGQTLEMYIDGILIGKYNVSTGREQPELAKSGRRYFSRTPTGTYGIYNRRVRHWSNTWKAWMPYSQFIVGGIAIHATTPDHYQQLGTRASGGCIRLTYKNAKTLWDLVKMMGVGNTSVTIFDSSKDFNWMVAMGSTNDKLVSEQQARRAKVSTPTQQIASSKHTEAAEHSEAAELNRRELKRLERQQRQQQEQQQYIPMPIDTNYYHSPSQYMPNTMSDAPMPEKFYGIY